MSDHLDPVGLAELAELRASVASLSELVAQAQINLGQIAVTNGHRRVLEMRDWPVANGRRYVAGRPGYGAQIALAPGVATKIVGEDLSRLGGQIVVNGTGTVVLWLATVDATNAGISAPQMILEGQGGAWDFRLSGITWCGDVTAVAAAASSITLSIASV